MNISFNFTEKHGRIKPMHAVGQPPRLGISDEFMHYLTEAHIPYSRLHDMGGLYGGYLYVDIPNIFRDFSADENDPASYDFPFTDLLIKQMMAAGAEPIYRLGVTIENYQKIRAYRIDPPSDFGKWARICEHIIRHYNEGWADGFKYGIKYWEIWNEPDGQWCWKTGVSPEEYGDFALATARAIHEADPEAKAIAGVLCYVNLPYLKRMLDRGVAAEADAVSFHRYNANELDALNEMQALRALLDRYNPKVQIIQGESGTQSDSRGAGALRGGAWTPLKQAKYLLRHRLIDLSTDMVFTSHFSAMDMIEALNGKVGDKASYLDFGYFGVIQADFNEEGLATGEYTPKLSYRALQHLCTLFDGKAQPEQLPVRRVVNPSPRVFDKDASDSRLVMLGFRRGNGTALAYWEAADLMRETFDSTVSFQLAGVKDAPRLVDLLTGDVYQVPETLVKRDDLGNVVELVNLPLTDSPLLLMFGDFDE